MCLSSARYLSKCFTRSHSFNSRNSPVQSILLLSPFHDWETEAQKWEVTSLGSHSRIDSGPGLNCECQEGSDSASLFITVFPVPRAEPSGVADE